MATKVAGELYESITSQIFEIGRQLRQPKGYPFDPEKLQKHLQDAVEGKFNKTVVVQNFPTWKTILLGTDFKTVDDFRKAIKANRMKIGDWGNDILAKPAFTVSETKAEVELVRVTVGELGFKNGATRKEIYERAIGFGLKLCPNEVGPQLRIQYADQPMGEWLLVGMEPITDSDGGLRVFDVGRGGSGVWLDGNYGYSDGFWSAGVQWVFLRGK